MKIPGFTTVGAGEIEVDPEIKRDSWKAKEENC